MIAKTEEVCALLLLALPHGLRVGADGTNHRYEVGDHVPLYANKFISLFGDHPRLLLSKASVTYRGKNLYIQSPPIPEEMTRLNLLLFLFDPMGKVTKDTIHVSGTSEIND
ncbi:unnamed protein product [Musa acuminata subsp. burmannicoides]